MDRDRPFIKVPQHIVSRCKKFGHDLADRFRKKKQSNARSGGRGTEYNPEILGASKVGECATGILFGLDIEKEIMFTVEQGPDSGFDLVIGGCFLLDPKSTCPYRKLIWSRSVNDLFWKKPFHALVGVTVDRKDWTRTWIDGYIDKLQFYWKKGIADGNSPYGLEPGTWWVDKSIPPLSPIGELLRMHGMTRAAVRGALPITHGPLASTG